MVLKIDRYRVSAPLENGLYVGASGFVDAVKAFLPDKELELLGLSEGKWRQYKVHPPGDGTEEIPHGDRIDVELNGFIRVTPSALQQFDEITQDG